MKPSRTIVEPLFARKEGMKTEHGARRIEENYPDYLKDESGFRGKGVEALFFPRSAENIAYVLREAEKRRKGVTLSGGRTGICGGAVPQGGYLISLERMQKILSLEVEDGEYLLKAESGIRLSELDQKLSSRSLGLDGQIENRLKLSNRSYVYPPDPTETSATLGGSAATNASGARTFYYGPTRRYVVGLEVVLSSGELLRIRRGDVREEGGLFRVPKSDGKVLAIPAPTYAIPKSKHSAGFYSERSMDLIDLFIGSEGILGIIVNVTVRLVEEPALIVGGVAFFQKEEDAVEFVEQARKAKAKPLALEYFDRNSLFLLDEVRRSQGPSSEIPLIPLFGGAIYFESPCFHADNLEQTIVRWKHAIESSGGDASLSWGALYKRDIQRLKSFRHALPESINRIIAQNRLVDERIHKVGTDMTVPDDHLREMVGYYRDVLERQKLRYAIFGHIGDNHLHVNMIPSSHEELLQAKELYTLFARKAVSLGGSVSGEHGIGKLKKEYLTILFDQGAIFEMRSIKASLDPHLMLNPGTLL